MKSCALILALLGLLAPSACEKQETDPMNWVEWKTPMSAALDSIQVVAPVNAEIIFESHNSEDEPDIQVFGASCGYRLEFSSRKFNVDSISVSNQTDERMELTVTKTDLEVSRAPSSGPWWPAVLVAILSGFGLKGGLNFEGRGGLLCLALLSLWTLTLAACSENVTIKVSVPSSMCFNAVSESGIDVWPCPRGNFPEDFLWKWEEGEASVQEAFVCNGRETSWELDLTTDRNGRETSWELWKDDLQVNRGPPATMATRGPPATMAYRKIYEDEKRYVYRQCLGGGQYTFKLKDEYVKYGVPEGGDGFQGSISMKLAGIPLLFDVANMKSGQKMFFEVETGGNMLPRDSLWLDAHNSLRKEYMKWSNGLKKDAKEHADWLALNECKEGQTTKLVHEKGIKDGENLYAIKNWGSWSKKLPSPGLILSKWVEKRKESIQVLWVATNFVGCGEGMKKWVKTNGKEEVCHVQVCRYVLGSRNCYGKLDDTTCGRKCPDEGC